jgi:hypothetical protein
MDAYAAAYETPEMKAYQGTEEFKAYLVAKEVWEVAHDVYRVASPAARDRAFETLNAANAEKDRCLELARKTPEHKAAFGW